VQIGIGVIPETGIMDTCYSGQPIESSILNVDLSSAGGQAGVSVRGQQACKLPRASNERFAPARYMNSPGHRRHPAIVVNGCFGGTGTAA
jgi:hypothetical protein